MPAKDYRVSAFHYLTKDGLALMVFYDYLLSDEGYLMEDNDYPTFWKDNLTKDFQ